VTNFLSHGVKRVDT